MHFGQLKYFSTSADSVVLLDKSDVYRPSESVMVFMSDRVAVVPFNTKLALSAFCASSIVAYRFFPVGLVIPYSILSPE